jgi:hypothetical protein
MRSRWLRGSAADNRVLSDILHQKATADHVTEIHFRNPRFSFLRRMSECTLYRVLKCVHSVWICINCIIRILSSISLSYVDLTGPFRIRCTSLRTCYSDQHFMLHCFTFKDHNPLQKCYPTHICALYKGHCRGVGTRAILIILSEL